MKSSFMLMLSVLQVILGSNRAHAEEITRLNEHFRASVSWAVDPFTMQDVLRGFIEYTPVQADPECKQIRFIQAARVEVKLGQDFVWQFQQVNRNQMKSADGYFIDHNGFMCTVGKNCSPYYRDYWPNSDESQDGTNGLTESLSASLVDYPSSWTEFQRITLESCAQCTTSGEFFGCVHWGADWPNNSDRTFLPITVSSVPSVSFLSALERFTNFYRGKI